ncbi:hypothetical protein C8R46DRAFT_1286157 [Mycena filopes]|nr:hypothetical protein C8R46DRAFT_1286157 [Mycena filopes]
MPGILDLAAELLQEVYSMVPWEDKKGLRSTCRRVDSVLGPLLLSHLLIAVERTTSEQLRLLATPTYRGSSFVKSLMIERFAWPQQANIEDKVIIRDTQDIRELLAPALSALKNLRRVNWELDNRDIGGVSTLILDTLTHLEVPHLEIIVPESIPLAIPFEHFRNLGSISIKFVAGGGRWTEILERVIHPLAEAIKNSPALKSITIIREHGYDKDVYRRRSDEPDPLKEVQRPCFNHLMPLENPPRLTSLVLRTDTIDTKKINRSYLGCLRSLTLELPEPKVIPDYGAQAPSQYYAPTADSDVVRTWRQLANEEIFTSVFCTTAPVDHAAVGYLKAHPGFQRLELGNIPKPFNPNEFDHVYATMFYTEVLPGHAATLTHLTIRSGRYGPWAVTVQSAKAILQCRALKFLSMAVNMPSTRRYATSDSESHEGSGPSKVRVDDTLLLLDVAFELPLLISLHIHQAPEYLPPMGRVCGTSRLRLRSQWSSIVRVTVENFRAVAPPSPEQQMSFQLCIGSYYPFLYCLEVGDDGGWRLREISEAEQNVVRPRGLGPWLDRNFLAKLPPRKRLSIEELYSG